MRSYHSTNRPCGTARSVYYYRRSGDGGARFDLAQKITARDGAELDQFGGNKHHIATSSDGNFMVVGTHDDDDGRDKYVYVFARFIDGGGGDSWKEVAKIEAPDDSCYFRGYVVIAGGRVLISLWENAYWYELECSYHEEPLFK